MLCQGYDSPIANLYDRPRLVPRRAQCHPCEASGARTRSQSARLGGHSCGERASDRCGSKLWAGNPQESRSGRDAIMILVTGAAGAVGGIGRNLTELLLARGHTVRALVRREDERAEALRRLGAEVVRGDLTDLASMHRAIEGCGRIYFGMSVSAAYLEATINTAAVARHHGVEAFVNMSQMTVTQMSISETTDSPQHKLHWLAEQALSWSGLPVVTVRPTVFLEGFFLLLAT